MKPIRSIKQKPFSTFVIATLFFQSAFALSDEQQMISRITALWKDKQTHLVKEQVKTFFERYPKSSSRPLVEMALAYAYRQEGHFKEAKEILESIPERDQNEESFTLLIDCHYQLKEYSKAASACRSLLKKDVEKTSLIYGYLGLSLLQKGKLKIPQSNNGYNLDADQKAELKSALSALEKAGSSTLQQTVALSQVEILRLLKEHKKAHSLAKKIAGRDSENKESLLFIAASEASHFDADESLKLFEKIAEENKAHSPLAAYNWMVGLIREKRFKAFIDKRTSIKKHLSSKHTSLFTFYLAEASFHTEDFSKALRLLQEISHTLQGPQKKRGLILMAFCADKTNNTSLLKKAAVELMKLYPEDPFALEAAILYVKRLQKKGLFQEAKTVLEKALSQKVDTKKRAQLELLGLCLEYQMEHFDQVLDGGLKLFDSIGASASDTQALLELMAASALKGQNPSYTKALETLLEKSRALSITLPVSFSLGYVELLLADKALLQARSFLEDEIKAAIGPKLHGSNASSSHSQKELSELYKALSKTYSLEDEAQKRSYFLELALKTKAQSDEKKLPIYLELFNAYRRLYILGETIDEWHEKKGKSPMQLAAAALFNAYQIDPKRVGNPNKQWLADFYFDQVEKEAKAHFKAPLPKTAFSRSFTLYKALVENSEDARCANNLVRLAKLILLRSQRTFKSAHTEKLQPNASYEALIFLKRAYALMEKSPDGKAPLIQSDILLHIGRCYERDDAYRQAEKAYLQAISIAKISRPADKARLQLCRLRLKEGSRHLNEVITTLKDLQLKKSLDYEPLFLESAIDYIEASCLGIEPSARDEKKLFLLERMEEDFWDKSGALNKHYHEKRENLQNQNRLFLAYMQYVELHLQFLKAKALYKEKRSEGLEALRAVRLEITKNMTPLTSHTEYLEIKTHLLLGLIDDLIR